MIYINTLVPRIAVILGACTAASIMISGIPKAVQSSTEVFRTLSPYTRQLAETISGSGELSFSEQHDITSSLPLVIKRFTVKEGDFVNVGDTIAEVDRKSSAALIESLGKVSALAISAANLSTAIALLPDTITSDCNGRVISTSGNGCAVQSGSSIATIAAEETLVVTAAISELDIAAVKLGQTAQFTLSAYPNEIFTGTVSAIANAARSQYNGSVLETVVDVQILPSSTDSRLKAGLTAQADIALSEPHSVLVLPYSAIGQDDSSEYVWVYENNTAVRKSIITGHEFSDGAEITSGITAECLVLDNPENISLNSHIRVEDGQ